MTHSRPIKPAIRATLTGPIAARARRNGFNLNHPITTVDGDEVILIAIQTGHPFPIVGEVHDYNANVGWLARWNEGGQYRGTLEASARHGLRRNMGDEAEAAPFFLTPRPILPIQREGLKFPLPGMDELTRRDEPRVMVLGGGSSGLSSLLAHALRDRSTTGTRPVPEFLRQPDPVVARREQERAFDAEFPKAVAAVEAEPEPFIPGLSKLLAEATLAGEIGFKDGAVLAFTVAMLVKHKRLVLPSADVLPLLPVKALIAIVETCAKNPEAIIRVAHIPGGSDNELVDHTGLMGGEVGRRLRFADHDVLEANEARHR